MILYIKKNIKTIYRDFTIEYLTPGENFENMLQ